MDNEKDFLLFCVYFLTLTFASGDKQHGLDNVWISKIFSDSMWHFAVNSSLNTECTQQGLVYLQHLHNNTHWAIRMLDASLVSPSGLISGDDIQFGHPDQCIQTQIPIRNFSTKYCLPTAHFAPYPQLYPEYYNPQTSDWPPYDMDKNVWDFIRPRDEFIRNTRQSFSWGLCVPEICTAPDIQASLNETLFKAFAKHEVRFEVNLTDINCYSSAELESRKLPAAGQGFLIVVTLLFFLSVLGTTLDYRDSRSKAYQCPEKVSKPGPIKSFVLNFSWIAHTKSLCSTKGNGGIIYIDGVKGMLIIFTIILHRAIFGAVYAVNLEFVEQALHDVKYAWLTGSGFMLDAFFVISGFLLAWGVIQKIKRSGIGSISYRTIIVKRCLRIYPMYIAVICFVIWVNPYVGGGPLWKSYVNTQSEICQQNWWLNILFIHTLVDSRILCLLTSWYVSTDFQLYLISLALIYLATNTPAWRNYILVTALILAYAVPAIVIYFTQDFSFMMYSVSDERNAQWITGNYFRRLYSKFYMRAPPYIFGLCSAFLADHLTKKKFQVRGWVMVVLFFTFVYLLFFLFHVGSLFYLPNHVYSVWEHVVFATLSRLVWPLFNVIFIIFEVTGQQNFTSQVFTSPIPVVIGRLSYPMYLFNTLVIYISVYQSQNSGYISTYNYIFQCFADVGMITALAYIASMLLDYPMEKLRRLIV